MLKPILLTIITTLIISSAQILWKIGLAKIGGFYIKENSMINNILRVALSWQIITGLILYAIATVIFLFLLNEYPISLVVPLSSISFLFTMFAGVIFFQENINIVNWLGSLVIILGVYLITYK